MNKKKKGWIFLLVSIFMILSMSVLIIIGSFSDYLIKNVIRYIAIGILVVFTIFGVYSIYLLHKYRRRRNYKKWIIILFDILIGLYAAGCASFIFLLYGPMNNFRDWLITTAMGTMNHQYLCKWFYNDDIIEKALSNNFIIESDDETDTSMINKNNVSYKNEYDKEILDHDDDQLYKIIRFKVNGQQAYLAAVYDASKISVGVTKWLGRSGQYGKDIAKENNAVLAINGGGFYDPGYNGNGAHPVGVTISNGKIITNNDYGSSMGSVVGFTEDDILVLKKGTNANALIESGVRDAVTMGPFLIVNGKSSFMKGNGGWGYAARTAIGQRADGIVLFLVVDSNTTRTKGASMIDLAEIMERYGAINAINLDGGTSSIMVENGEIINDPIDSTGAHKTRGIPTIFMVKE